VPAADALSSLSRSPTLRGRACISLSGASSGPPGQDGLAPGRSPTRQPRGNGTASRPGGPSRDRARIVAHEQASATFFACRSGIRTSSVARSAQRQAAIARRFNWRGAPDEAPPRPRCARDRRLADAAGLAQGHSLGPRKSARRVRPPVAIDKGRRRGGLACSFRARPRGRPVRLGRTTPQPPRPFAGLVRAARLPRAARRAVCWACGPTRRRRRGSRRLADLLVDGPPPAAVPASFLRILVAYGPPAGAGGVRRLPFASRPAVCRRRDGVAAVNKPSSARAGGERHLVFRPRGLVASSPAHRRVDGPARQTNMPIAAPARVGEGLPPRARAAGPQPSCSTVCGRCCCRDPRRPRARPRGHRPAVPVSSCGLFAIIGPPAPRLAGRQEAAGDSDRERDWRPRSTSSRPTNRPPLKNRSSSPLRGLPARPVASVNGNGGALATLEPAQPIASRRMQIPRAPHTGVVEALQANVGRCQWVLRP